MAQPSFSLAYDRLVSLDGYEWRDAHLFDIHRGIGGKQRFIVDLSDGRRKKLSRPLEHTGLFREFADCDISETGFKEFAGRNGDLGMQESIVSGPIEGGKDVPVKRGELFSVWHTECIHLRQCLQLADAARDGDLDTLRKHIIWEGSDRVDYASIPDWVPGQLTPPDEIATFAHIATSDSFLMEKLTPGDVVVPALSYVQMEVNKRLTKHTRLRMRWTEDLTGMQNFAVPKNMLGAIWLQFALSIQNKSAYRRCAQCNKWFELSPKVARSDKQFCSSACRLKAFRHRKLLEGHAQNHDHHGSAQDGKPPSIGGKGT